MYGIQWRNSIFENNIEFTITYLDLIDEVIFSDVQAYKTQVILIFIYIKMAKLYL